MKIIVSEPQPKACSLAAEAFQALYRAVTSQTLPIITQDDGDDLVAIGGCDVNAFARRAMLDGWGPETAVPIGSDGYAMLSVRQNGRNVLFLWGGRGRSTLYAVYAFFENQAGCRYFWDGDVIPKLASIPIANLNVVALPDFELRGIRYFAHRGLHRFQAEHWDLSDWKREIDWLVKRRLNLFMLRIGSDGLFQEAFPNLVAYPPAKGVLPEAGTGYDNRTLFWSLEYRQALRKQVLRYAFDRDLIQPIDCGTTTHWYSRTPQQFLQKVNPDFMPQVSDVYRQPTGLVWDIRQDRALEDYFTLTRTEVKISGQSILFHTIGLAERMCSRDRAQNMRYKTMAYRRILSRVDQEWPNAPVLIASWDFAMHWEPREVRKLLQEFDPRRHIILDYTADTQDARNNFLHWGFYRKFPWVFGIFHAFEPNSDLRGDYAALSQRVDRARRDPMCKGFVFWPELSHSDILMLEYFARSAWQATDFGAMLSDFCADRYGDQSEPMLSLWQSALPLLPLHVWTLDRQAAIEDMHQEPFFDVLAYRPLQIFPAVKLRQWREMLMSQPTVYASSAQCLRLAAGLLGANIAFIQRDVADIARTALGRCVHLMLLRLICDAAEGRWHPADAARYQTLLETLGAVLDSHEDYSQWSTLHRLEQVHKVNAAFEPAFKQNLANGYCRGYAAEFFRRLCLPENAAYLSWLEGRSKGEGDAEADRRFFAETEKRLYENYMAKPLFEMKPQPPVDLGGSLLSTACLLDEIGKDTQAREVKHE